VPTRLAACIEGLALWGTWLPVALARAVLRGEAKLRAPARRLRPTLLRATSAGAHDSVAIALEVAARGGVAAADPKSLASCSLTLGTWP
jgi:hypothetical protein